MATFKAIVFQTGRHIKQDGTSNIKIRIYHNRESQYIATSYGEMIEYVGHTVSCISCLIMLSGTLLCRSIIALAVSSSERFT